jgi:hypothetical protein
MELPPHIIETVQFLQIEDTAIKALLTTFEQKAPLVGARIRETSDRIKLVQLNKNSAAIQKQQAALGRKIAKLSGHATRGNVSKFGRELDRMLQTARNIKRDMIMLDGQLDEILVQLDKL